MAAMLHDSVTVILKFFQKSRNEKMRKAALVQIV